MTFFYLSKLNENKKKTVLHFIQIFEKGYRKLSRKRSFEDF